MRICLVLAALVASFAALAPDGALRAQPETPALTLIASRDGWLPGGWVTVEARLTRGAEDPEPSLVLFDPKEIGEDQFPQLIPYSFSCRPNDECRYFYSFTVSAHLQPGRHLITASAAIGDDRVARGSLTVEIAPPTDTDRDGLRDAWERHYSLDWMNPAGDEGPNGDPDADGISNAEEYAAHTNPVGRYERLFVEASYGEAPALIQCFTMGGTPSRPGSAPGRRAPVRMVFHTDVGRTREVFLDERSVYTWQECPFGVPWPPFLGGRVVYVTVESFLPLAIERNASRPGAGSRTGSLQWPLYVGASIGARNAERTWYFGRSGSPGQFDVMYLGYNPHPFRVMSTFIFVGGDRDVPIRITRPLEPHTRTAISIANNIVPAAAADRATLIAADQPIVVERAWRHHAEDRERPHEAPSPGAARTSSTWYFAAADLSEVFDTSFSVVNPTTRTAAIEATFMFPDRDPVVRRLNVSASRRAVLVPRDLGIGSDNVALMLKSANGVAIAAERILDGSRLHEPWRHAAPGLTGAGAEWVFARGALSRDDEVAIANISDVTASVRLHFAGGFCDSCPSTTIETVDVAPRRTARIPALWTGGSLIVTSQAAGSGPLAQLVVERITYEAIAGVRRARQVVVAGELWCCGP